MRNDNAMKLNIIMYTEGIPFTGDSLEQGALGGSESAFIYVARAFAGSGHHVMAFCLCPQPGNYHGVTYHDITQFESWSQEGACDLFICSRFYHVFLQRPFRSKVNVLWNHDIQVEPGDPRFMLLSPILDYIYCLSDFHLRNFRGIYPSLDKQLKKISNGIDWNLIHSVLEQNLPKKHRIMFSSRPSRGLMNALEIYERYGDKQLEFITCTYPVHAAVQDQHYENACRDKLLLLQKQGFPIVADSFPKKKLYTYLAESKAAVYPTHFPETFCISAAEAQACKTVFLTSYAGSLPEVVPYEQYPVHATDQWLAALHAVLHNEEKRQEWVEQGWQNAQQYNWSKVAQQFIDDALEYGLETISNKPSNNPEIQDVDTLSSTPPSNSPAHLITCFTITHSITALSNTIQCYIDQTHPHCELLIYTKGVRATSVERLLQQRQRDDIRFIGHDEQPSIAQSWDKAKKEAQGDVICYWSDQSLHHPEFLQEQLRYMTEQGADACLLRDQLYFNAAQQELYWLDWLQDTPVGGKEHTLMCTTACDIPYPEQS